ncbi:MAG TPA: hypothetical protein ENI96_09105 [Sedimenticola thiotaurini]|uniref:Uncharacterized protein n=1 Tax=Sedimenticola thiotaurini TaxID=1543721 RepID=A0A831W5Q2_9GAMM|nr:hypothetical protein [Sedimenticola thiotaurini]
MGNLLAIVGNSAAVVGILICLVAGLTRLSGGYYLFGYELSTLFLGGTSLMVLACLAKLQQLLDRR